MTEKDWEFLADMFTDAIKFRDESHNLNYPFLSSGEMLLNLCNAIRSGDMEQIKAKHKALGAYKP